MIDRVFKVENLSDDVLQKLIDFNVSLGWYTEIFIILLNEKLNRAEI